MILRSLSIKGSHETILIYLDYFRHLLDVYHAISIDVIHSESPFKFLFRRSTRCDVYC